MTDFGACRPVTEEAVALVKDSSKNLLLNLRDGDWKPTVRDTEMSSECVDTNNNETTEEDLRIEGTTAYLPPEVVVGGYPTAAADVWALGCVLFQCISGRPPILEDNDDLTALRIVTFHLNSDPQDFFGECDPSTFCDDTKSLIQRMLNREVNERPSIPQIATD